MCVTWKADLRWNYKPRVLHLHRSLLLFSYASAPTAGACWEIHLHQPWKQQDDDLKAEACGSPLRRHGNVLFPARCADLYGPVETRSKWHQIPLASHHVVLNHSRPEAPTQSVQTQQDPSLPSCRYGSLLIIKMSQVNTLVLCSPHLTEQLRIKAFGWRSRTMLGSELMTFKIRRLCLSFS